MLMAVAIVALPACGGGGVGFAPRPTPQPQLTPPATLPAPESSLPSRNRLIATMPPLGRLPPGSEFEFVLRGEFREEVHQGSGRVLYDDRFLEPISVSRGNMIPGDGVFMSKLDEDGFVPFAFTALPDSRGISAGRGELLRVRFRLVAEPPSGLRVQLWNEAAYLQIRDGQRRRLSFDLATEVVSQ